MLKDLKEYPRTIKQFIDYLKVNNIEINAFFNNDVRYRLSFYIEFLSLYAINITYDDFNYVVSSLTTFKIISQSDNKNRTTIIDNLKLGIIEGFKHLETPF